MQQLYPLLFEPNLHRVVWGGNRLRPMKGLSANEEPIGESWEVSAVESSTSVVSNGSLAGRDLISIVGEFGKEILGEAISKQYEGKFPLLVKLIDTNNDLSIQVHPNDALAKERHGKFGKTEMWYVIDAQPGSYLYAGFKDSIGKEEYARRVADGTICDVLARHEVQSGDVFYIPAGRIHAIGKGILLAEVQQSSDVTYRIYDYNRLGLDGKPRELHTELAVDAIDFSVEDDYLTHYRSSINHPERVIDSPFFKVKMLQVNRSFHRRMYKYDTFIIYTCINGECKIVLRDTNYSVVLKSGNSCLIPASVADYDVVPIGESPRLLEIYIDNRRSKFRKMLSKVRFVRKFFRVTKR
ncbi:MAG: class I mannose-6-phosphate isomerase [Bacteroidales bacterium]|nr:class I mannose-6-phosphate isomerase [Bacteroidales bacterium]